MTPEPHSALPRPIAAAVALVTGLVLGALAALVDEIPGPRVLVIAVSSGLSWGAAAVALGALSRDRLGALLAATLAPVTAVLTYYAAIETFGLRPKANVLRAAVVWTAVAVTSGPVAGLAGWYARRGTGWRRPVAWGAIAGVLLGQGLRWAWEYGLSPDPVFTPALVLPVLALLWGTRHGGLMYAVPALLGSALLSAGIWGAVAAVV